MAASQQAMIADIIEAVKRKRIERGSTRAASLAGSSQSISTNRGNKLVRNAEYVQKGRLNMPSSVSLHKEVVNFNGYQRTIIAHKPAHYDDDGDLVEDEDEIDAGNASAAEEDVYENTKLEEIFMPLTAASDLPSHPSMSVPYHEKGLPEMIRNLEEDLHRQQETLWKVKTLWTQFRGDSVWAPVENFHDGLDDWLLGESSTSIPARPTIKDHGSSMALNGDAGQALEATAIAEPSRNDSSMATAEVEDADVSNSHEASNHLGVPPTPQVAAANNNRTTSDGSLAHAYTKRINVDHTSEVNAVQSNGIVTFPVQLQAPPTVTATDNGHDSGMDDPAAGINRLKASEEGVSPSGGDIDSQPLSHRMTTRARANRGSRSSSRTRSDSAPTSVQPIHPFFQFPASAVSDENAGLPAQLADESRAYLLQYISKQEEVIRQQQMLLAGLRKALEMRQNVFRWTKAEGHVGEMSDGEDWYDKEEWKLDADLVKGKEEEEDDDRGKTRRRGRGEKNN